MTDKNCSRCGALKPLTAFHRNATKATGRDAECMRCKRTRENTPESREAKRASTLLRSYGITLGMYEAMVEEQGNRCGICGKPETKTNRYGERLPLAIDHDHKTGKVRGLLCSSHNKALGLLGDAPALLEAALRYLRGPQCAPC